MPAKPGPKVSRAIQAKARELLAFAEQRAAQAGDAVELSNALFGVDGKATQLFPTEAERTAAHEPGSTSASWPCSMVCPTRLPRKSSR
jgi:hypothetical protein